MNIAKLRSCVQNYQMPGRNTISIVAKSSTEYNLPMENTHLIDLSIKYGLSEPDMSKLINIAYQSGIHDLTSREFQRIAAYVCEMKLLDTPSEELLEELKLKGLIND